MGTRSFGLSKALLVALAGLLFLVFVFRWWGALIDDAYISLRYAEFLVDGQGLVWNPGERVEGYTNLLWVLFGALFLRLGFDPVAGLQMVSLVATAATLWVVARLATRDQGVSESSELKGAWLPAIVLLLSAESLGYYATSTMETTLFMALLTSGVWVGLEESRQGRRFGSVGLFILLTWTRPEGLLLFAVIQLLGVYSERRVRGTSGLRRRLIDSGAYFLAIGSWVLWRWFYYGELLPNTFHAKVTGGREQLESGWLTLSDWCLDYPVFTLTLLGPVTLVCRHSWRRSLVADRVVLWAVCGVWIGYVVLVGGDSMPFHRFLMPIVPLVAVLAGWQLKVWSVLVPRFRRHAFSVLVVLVGIQLVAGQRSDQPMRAFVADRTTRVGLQTGTFLQHVRSSQDLLAVNTAGALPWASQLNSLDMLGLTDATIAHRDLFVTSPRWTGHRRGWGDYVLERRPDVIVWYNTAGARDPHYLGDHQLAESPFFRFFYQRGRVELPILDEESRVLGRFWGQPFGTGGWSQNLGVRFEVKSGIWPVTEALPAPVVFDYFQRREDLEALWLLSQDVPTNVNDFLEKATQYWGSTLQLGDSVQLAAVEALCQQAARQVERGEIALARESLSRAAALNGHARSPLVGQYVANLAVSDGDLALAVQAQIEALRLAPGNSLYRKNLLSLLTVPWAEFLGTDGG